MKESPIQATVQKHIEYLVSESDSKREASVVALPDLPAEAVVPRVCEMLLITTSSKVQGACLDILESFGASYSLEDIRADMWFDRVADQVGNFDVICQVLGRRYLAYSMILGLQLHALTRDPRAPANTMVEFTSGDQLRQVLPLSEFRAKMVRALMQTDLSPPRVELPLGSDDVVAALGQTNVLLAPLFEISVRRLAWSPFGEAPFGLIGFVGTGEFAFMRVDDFDRYLKQKLQEDLFDSGEEPFQIDLTDVEKARGAAAQKDQDGVIAALENWPGLLAALHRTPTANTLTEQQLDTIAEGLLLLGDAFSGKERNTWAEELFRLGLQLNKEGAGAGSLFLRFGKLMNQMERYGEAIAYFRRASSLGVEQVAIYPALGRALLRRGKIFAAGIILAHAKARKYESDTLEDDLAEVMIKFEEAGVDFDLITPSQISAGNK